MTSLKEGGILRQIIVFLRNLTKKEKVYPIAIKYVITCRIKITGKHFKVEKLVNEENAAVQSGF